MAVNIKKKQVQEELEVQHLQTAEEQSVTEEQTLVNEYVGIAAELEDYKPMMKAAEEYKKQLQSIAKGLDPTGTQPVTIEGTNGNSVTFGPASDKRTIIDMNGLIGVLKKKVAYDDLMGMLTISMTDLDKVLSPAEQAPFVKKEVGGGSRSLKSYAKGE